MRTFVTRDRHKTDKTKKNTNIAGRKRDVVHVDGGDTDVNLERQRDSEAFVDTCVDVV